MTEPSRDRRLKIAVLGGGISSLTAAYELAIQDRYDITVYQLGWRLGGKGASGRNAEIGQRVEEHGLHIWFGFYENSFNLMYRSYQAVQDTRPVRDGRYKPFGSVQEAFTGQDSFVFTEKVDDRWDPWEVPFPGDDRFFPGIPGPDGRVGEYRSLWENMLLLLEFLCGHFDDHLAPALEAAQPGEVDHPHWWQKLADEIGDVVDAGARLAAGGFLHTALKVARTLDGPPAEHHHGWLSWLLLHFKEWLNREIGDLVHDNDELRRAWMILDLGLTCLIGMLADGVLTHGLDSINDRDFREWLREHGAAEHTVEGCLVRAMYDVFFAYEGGDLEKPNVEAGSALRGSLRTMLTYKGHVLFKMNAGMGDTIFSPIYLVLKELGVKFEFFHRVEDIRLTEDGNAIDSIDVARQVDLTDNRPSTDYDPLINVGGLPCWPNKPKQKEIVQDLSGVDLESRWAKWTDVGHRTLYAGKDFDKAILGISLSGLRFVAKDVIDGSEAWQQMMGAVKSVQTQSVQLWFRKTDDQLGWPVESGILGAYAEPFASWGDFDQLIDREDWPPGYHERSVFYTCGVLKDPEDPIPPRSDHDYPADRLAVLKANALAYLKAHPEQLWPNATDPDGVLKWADLVAKADMDGEDRLWFQYFRANIDPSERYVLTLADTSRYRLKAQSSGYDNLVITGTWIDNGFNLSCIEAAVMSGMQAARAISGQPQYIVGETD